MMWLCSTNPHVTSLNLNWETVLDFPVMRRNKLIEKLNEMQQTEVQAIKRSSSSSGRR